MIVENIPPSTTMIVEDIPSSTTMIVEDIPPSTTMIVEDIPPSTTMTVENITKIVLVMGITGAGKSFMIKEISGRDDVEVGHHLESCTQEVKEIKCLLGGHSVMILDTPGFDDTKRSDTEILTGIAEYLMNLYKANYRISGIIYLHSIADTRMRGSSYKNLQMFSKLCGEQSYHNSVMLTGRWSSIDQSLAEDRENQLKENFWKEHLGAGCQLDRYRDKNDLIRIFKAILQKPPVVLAIQSEMAEGKSLVETTAGEYVNQEQAKQKKKIEDEIAAISADYNNQSDQMKALMDEDRSKLQLDLEKLEAEKLMMMDSHKLAEAASKANMLEQLRELEQKQEEQIIEYERTLEEVMAIKDKSIRENARLDALMKRDRDQKAHREESRGFMTQLVQTFIGVLVHGMDRR
ncbi:gTPase, IMAP member 8 [Mortierella sp. AM989]|nr:gTPase, IMAP member 8 [Mortierella sp. AM989]